MQAHMVPPLQQQPPLPPPPGMQQQRQQYPGARQQQQQPPPQQRPQHAARPPQQQQQRQHGGRPPGSSSRRQQGNAAAATAAAAAAGGAQQQAVVPLAVDCTAELEQLRRPSTNFKCSIRFRNDLPEIPSDPKLITSTYDPASLSRFFVTSLEAGPRRELLLPADVGVPISLLDLERYDVPAERSSAKQRLHPADEALLQDVEGLPTGGASAAAGAAGAGQGASQSPLKLRRATKGLAVPWLMATSYLTSGSDAIARRGGAAAAAAGSGSGNRFQLASSGAAAAAGGAGGAAAANGEPELTREQQLADIEATFAAAAAPPTAHPTKPGVVAVRSAPLLPDLDAWRDKYVVVTFQDGDPANDSAALRRVADPAARAQLVSRGLLKSFNPQAEQDPAMALLLPTELAASVASGAPLDEAAGAGLPPPEGDWGWEAEYGFDLVGGAQLHGQDQLSQVLLVLRDEDEDAGGNGQQQQAYVGYTRLDGALRLRKRKRQPADAPRPEKAVVTLRPYNEGEEAERAARLAALQGGGDEEEQDMMAEEQDGGGDEAAAGDDEEAALFGGGGGGGEDDEEADGGLGFQ